MRIAPLLAFLLLLAPAVAMAQTPQAAGSPGNAYDPAEQVVGLFAGTCLRFPADPAGLRQALAQQGVPRLPAQANAFFLAGRQGVGYDASLPDIRLALVSGDDGSCSAYVDQASSGAVLGDLAQALAPYAPRPIRPPPSRDPMLHGTGYAVTIGGQAYVVYAVTSDSPGRIQGAITLQKSG